MKIWVPVTNVVKHESPENIKIENTQVFKEEGNVPLIKSEPVDESETSVDLNSSFGEDTKNIKEMKIEDLQDENNLRDHLSTNEDIKSMNSREDFSSSINDVSVEEVIKHEGEDAHYLNSDLVKQLMIKPAEEEGGDGEREEEKEVGVKKSKALDIAENERISLKEVSDSQVEEASTDLNLKKKILVKSSLKAGKRLRYIEKRGWFKIMKRKMDNKNNNNCNINSDEENDFERKNGISKEDPFSCSECNYSSYKVNLFKRHQMSHLSVKKFKCLHCSYSTNFNSYLKEHSVIHSNNRPFKCSYCDFASKLKSNLKKHENTHFKKIERINWCEGFMHYKR
ncbi:Zinc finger protein [Armadillidium vulgare]|nr:Zinc finger protein [Armadillidium vulgare]